MMLTHYQSARAAVADLCRLPCLWAERFLLVRDKTNNQLAIVTPQCANSQPQRFEQYLLSIPHSGLYPADSSRSSSFSEEAQQLLRDAMAEAVKKGKMAAAGFYEKRLLAGINVAQSHPQYVRAVLLIAEFYDLHKLSSRWAHLHQAALDQWGDEFFAAAA